MKRFAPVLMLLLLLVSPTLFAAEDISGKWVGTVMVTVDANPPQSKPALLVLKQAGTTLTGTVGGSEEDERIEIANGKVETVKKDGKDVTSVTFSAKDGHDDNSPAIQFVLTLVDGHLKGKAQAEMDGHKLVAILDVTRSK